MTLLIPLNLLNPLISALILNYRTPRPAVKCAQMLAQQTVANKMEVIIVENHSDDESIGILRNGVKTIPNTRVIESPTNAGFGKGYNLGMRHARGRYILINNPVKLLTPESVERMVNAMEADPTIGILGPKLIHEDGTLRDSFRRFPRMADVVVKRTALRRLFPQRVQRYLQTDADPDAQRDVDWLIGGCLLLRRDLIEEIGGFDDRFFLFFEDIDLCRRCWRAGKRVVYFPSAQATDRKKRLSEGGAIHLVTNKVGRAHIASALKYFWKWRLTP